METIRTYLENLFAQLPETPELVRLRDDMLRTMEDKYEELKSEGKSENEAVGIVISEFGNIDELLAELDLDGAGAERADTSGEAEASARREETSAGRTEAFAREAGASAGEPDFFSDGPEPFCPDPEQVDEIIRDKLRISRILSLGISLFLLGPALLLVVCALLSASGLFRQPAGAQAGLILMLLPLAVCLILGLIFTIYGRSLQARCRLPKNILPTPSLKAHILTRREDFEPQYAVMTALAILFAIFSPVPLLFFLAAGAAGRTGLSVHEGCTGAFFLLLFLALSLYLFLTARAQKRVYALFLPEEAQSGERRKRVGDRRLEEGLLKAVLSSYWPFVFIVYFIVSFFTGLWAVSWLIYWPIAPMVQRVLCARLDSLKKKRNRDGEKEEKRQA